MSSSGSTNGLSSSSSCPALIHLSFIICYEKKKKKVSTVHLAAKKTSCKLWEEQLLYGTNTKVFPRFYFPEHFQHLLLCSSEENQLCTSSQASPQSAVFQLTAETQKPATQTRSSVTTLTCLGIPSSTNRSPQLCFGLYSSMMAQKAGKRQLQQPIPPVHK